MDRKIFFSSLSPTDLGKIFLILTLAIGLGLRFFNLDQKVYSADEVRSIMRFSGYTTPDVRELAFIGEIIGKEDLQHFQSPNPERNLSDAIRSLSGNPEHPPLYHLLTRFWMQGIPVAHSARLFSIFLSVLAIPCLYWLCRELFGNSLTGWIAIALFAVSPFYILAAQNTTQYSLWTIGILLSGTLLLRAIRIDDPQSWFFYSVSLAFTFYAHLFSVSVAIAQGVYVILSERFKLTKTSIGYVLAGIGSLLLFSPWIFMILTHLDKINENTRYYRQFTTNIIQISQTFFRHFGHVYIDFFHRKGEFENALHWFILLLVLYSFYYLIRSTEHRIWLFIITLIFIPVCFQVVPDLLASSIRSLQARYYLPVFLGSLLSLSYLIASFIGSRSRKNWLHHFGQQLLILFLVLGIVSGICLGWTADAGLDDQRGTASATNLPIAAELNRLEKPLVISESTPSFLLALSYLVNDRVRFQLFQDNDIGRWEKKLDLDRVRGQYSDILLLYPDDKFLGFLKERYSIRAEPVVEGLLKIQPR